MNLFVWDFHGVLEKGNEGAVTEVSNRVLEQFGYAQRFTPSDVNRLYGLKWHEYFSDLLPKEPAQRHYLLQECCIEMSRAQPEIITKNIQPNDHIHKVLEKISKKNSQILISNTDPETLVFFLNSVSITKYFPNGRAFGTDTHPKQGGRTKLAILRDYLSGKEFEKIIVIGDSPDDIKLAHSVGAVSYLYSYPGKPFRKCDADHRITDLRKVLKEVQTTKSAARGKC